ncbi:MAG: hypothetical protein M1835_006237 [Candelina submexicana]|nr:MAG: hypothetical protein M1835_006237 [Candelina submexicana]
MDQEQPQQTSGGSFGVFDASTGVDVSNTDPTTLKQSFDAARGTPITAASQLSAPYTQYSSLSSPTPARPGQTPTRAFQTSRARGAAASRSREAGKGRGVSRGGDASGRGGGASGRGGGASDRGGVIGGQELAEEVVEPRSSPLNRREKDELVQVCIDKESVYRDINVTREVFWEAVNAAFSGRVQHRYKSSKTCMRTLTAERRKVRPETESGRDREDRNEMTIRLDAWIDIVDQTKEEREAAKKERQRIARELTSGVAASQADRDALAAGLSIEEDMDINRLYDEQEDLNEYQAAEAANAGREEHLAQTAGAVNTEGVCAQSAAAEAANLAEAARAADTEEVRAQAAAAAETASRGGSRVDEDARSSRSSQSRASQRGRSRGRGRGTAAQQQSTNQEDVERRRNANGVGSGMTGVIRTTFEEISASSRELVGVIRESAAANQVEQARIDSLEARIIQLGEQQTEAAEESRLAIAESMRLAAEVAEELRLAATESRRLVAEANDNSAAILALLQSQFGRQGGGGDSQ